MERDNTPILIKMYDEDLQNLAFAMRHTGIKKKSSAIKHALKMYKEHAELLDTLKTIQKDTAMLKATLYTVYGLENGE